MEPGNPDDLMKLFKALEQSLNEPERELWRAIQAYIDAKKAGGMSRGAAYAEVRQLFRKVRDIRARERRASFKVVY